MASIEPTKEFEDQIRAAVSTPDANPEFVEHLYQRLARLPAPQPKPRFTFQPAWVWGATLLLVVIIAASSPGVVGAFRQLFRFVPGIGLVEPGEILRMMPEPVSVTRDGITLTIDHALVYPRRIDVAYTVTGIPGELRDGSGEQACAGADMYPRLVLANGVQAAADPIALGGSRSPSGYTAGHSFSIAVPADTRGAVFQLTCLQETRRGSAPEDWSIPFVLIEAPAQAPVGKELAAANAPAGQMGNQGIAFSFEGGALHEDGYHIFFRFASQNNDPDYLNSRPLAVYALDSSGKRIELINALPWSPFDKVDVWEYRMVAQPAAGPLVLVFEGAQIYYLAQGASFTFTPGPDPEPGQAWQINRRFEIGGHSLVVESARKIELEGHPGFEFTITSEDADLKLGVELMDMHSGAQGYDVWSTTGSQTVGSRVTPGFVYTSSMPESVQVTFNTISVQAEGSWKLNWTPPAE